MPSGLVLLLMYVGHRRICTTLQSFRVHACSFFLERLADLKDNTADYFYLQNFQAAVPGQAAAEMSALCQNWQFLVCSTFSAME